MNIGNIFDFTDKTLISRDCIMQIREFEWFLSIMSIDSNNSKCSYYSDEWLYLINANYPNAGAYYSLVNQYNNILGKVADINYNNHVVSLITTFSRGSVHGYSGFWYTLLTYLDNIELYKGLDIIIYKDCDKGMMSIIDHLCNIGVITNRIIYLEKNVIYKFNSVTYIENKYHVFRDELEKRVTAFIEKYIIIGESRKNKNLCILKTNASGTNITNNGVLDNVLVDTFCNTYSIDRMFPSNEIELINSIYKCKTVVLNYGSTFFKNYVYISESCERIIVIINGPVYINDYLHLSSIIPSKTQGIIYRKYKNAEIKYVIVNNELNFDPFKI